MYNNDDQYISFYDLFKAIKPIYDRYKLENSYYQNEFYYSTYGNYYLDYYNYKKKELIIGENNPFTIMNERTFNISKENGKFINRGKCKNSYVDDMIFKHSDFFEEAITFYERFRAFKTEPVKDLLLRSSDNKKYFLNISAHSMDFVEYLNDNPKEQEIIRYTLFFDGTKNISGKLNLVEYYRKFGDKFTKKSLIINKQNLPYWCNQVINIYESKHNNFINKLIKSINRKPPIIENDKLNEEKIERENTVNNQEKDSCGKVKVSPDLLFEQVDNHLEISKKYINNLEYIDLRNISFDGVLISGIDFTDTNIDFIDPQKVYNKDLSFSSFGNIDEENPLPFNESTNFNNVNLCGTVILGASESKYDLTNAITDSNTKFLDNHNVNKAKRKSN